MLLKSLIIFDFVEPFKLNAETLSVALSSKQATDCTALQEETYGWVPPFEGGSLFCESMGNFLFFSARHQRKEIRSAALNERLTSKISEIQQSEDRRIGRKERSELKDSVKTEMLPNAFPVSKTITGIIDLTQQRLLVNASSVADADNLTSHLREALGSLKVLPIKSENAYFLDNYWANPNTKPESVDWLGELTLQMPGDSKIKAKFSNLAIDDSAIAQCISDSMRLTQASLSFNDQLAFVLNTKWQIKRLKFAEDFFSQSDDSGDPRADALLQAQCIQSLLLAFDDEIVRKEKESAA